MCPERKNRLFAEDGIMAAIDGNLDALEAGLKPVVYRRPVFVPYQKHPIFEQNKQAQGYWYFN